MSETVWYISKYVALPMARAVGTRGFMLMREMARKGHNAVIITSDSNHLVEAPFFEGSQMTMDVDGVQVTWLRTLKYNSAKSMGRIASWFDFEWRLWRMPKDAMPRPDAVIISSLSLLTIFNGMLLRRRYGCRLVFEVRDIWPLTIVETGKFSPRNPFVWVLAQIEKLAYRHADEVVGTMPNLGEHVAEVLGYSRPAACIPMGVDDELLQPPEPLPADYEAHFPDNKFIVCHAGTIGIDNALETIVAAARVLRDRTDIHFMIVGRGGQKARFEAECADLPNVSFPPAVPRNVVQSVLRRCDLLYFSVHVSKVWKFGQSLNKVVDYMLACKPIVASYTGFPSMIDEAQSGSFVPAGDADALSREIVRYAEMSADERATIGQNGRRWLLANRRYENLAVQYLELAVGHKV